MDAKRKRQPRVTPAARRSRRGSPAGLLVVGLLALASPGSAAVFNYLPTAPEVTPAGTGWRDVDVSAYVPVGATGVIVQWNNASPSTGGDEDYGVRKKGSTDPVVPSAAKDGQQGWLMTGLDANRVFQVNTGTVGVKTYLLGYTTAGVTFLTNRVDKSTASAGWVDVSIAADTGSDTAIGAIFAIHCNSGSGSNCVYGVRKKGSTDNRLYEPRADVVNLVIIGVDQAETAQQNVSTAAMDLYLVGYVTRGAVFFTNALNKSTGTTGSYVPVDMTADLGAGVGNGVFLEILDTGNTDRLTAVRPGGSSYDYYANVRHQWAVAGLDAGDVFEQKIENTTHDVYVVGYSLAGASSDFRVTSGSYVGNGTGQSITGIGFTPDMVLVDGDGGGNQCVVKTSTMSGLNSKDLDAASGFNTTQIVSLDADGFSVGTDADANQNGITYYWVAFKAAPGYMKIGTYAGAAAAQNIGGVGFTPAYVWVMSPNGPRAVQKSDLMPITFSITFDSNGYGDAILDIQGNGFRVGTNTAVSGAGTTFHYVAWNRAPGRIAVGTYTGDNTNDRDIGGVGFWPEYVIVDRSTNAPGGQGNPPAHKPASTGTGTDTSLLFNNNIVEADNIQALQADGFQLGTHCRVNGDGTCPVPVPVAYYYAAFGPHTASGLYRSAGTNAGNLNTAPRTVTISGTTATFSGAMPNNVGVGDVLQYQVTGTWYLAFIQGRTSSTVYSVRTASGGTPQPAVAGTAVGVYRAYTSLSNWQALTGNASLQPTVLPFDTSRDLVAAGGPMHVACYNDGPMNDTVNVSNSWITSPGTYIRIFTPTKTYEVGTSQRHTGVAGTGFRLTPVSAADQGFNIVNVNTPYLRIEGLEIDGSGLTTSRATRGINVTLGLTNVGDLRVDSCLIHDLHTRSVTPLAAEGSMGIMNFQAAAATGPPMTITNNIIYDITNDQQTGHIGGIHVGARGTSYVLNNTIYAVNNFTGCAGDCGPSWGIYAKAFGGGAVDVVVQNNYVGNVTGKNGPNIFCYDTESGGNLILSYNVSSDNTAAGTGSQINKTAYATYFQSIVNGSENLHLTAASSAPAMFNAAGTDLSPAFFNDIDGQLRTVAWDVGADEFDGTTAVKLMSFEALPGDASVTLQWRTGSELSNLGFHVYRGPSADGPWVRLTSSLIPGLGTSAVGQSYSWRDTGLDNGVRYYYRLEDVDTRARSTLHGPLSAVPVAGAPVADDGKASGDGPGRSRRRGPGSSCPAWVLAGAGVSASDAPECSRHGDPEAVSLEVVSRTSGSAVIELRTGGFYALHERDGSVRVFVEGFDSPSEATAAALPLRRALVAAVAGRQVRLVSAAPFEQARFAGLRPAAVGVADMDVSWDGTVRPRRRALAAAHGKGAFRLPPVARLAPSVFQGESKSAVVEIMPIRFDEKRQALVLARRVRVRLAFSGREAGESGSGSRGRALPRRRTDSGEVLAQLHTSGRGLYSARFEALFGSRRSTVAVSQLSLERQGEPVPFHVEPAGDVFGPGGTLYFFTEREAASTDYSGEVAFELVRSSGTPMAVASARPRGPAAASSPIALATAETNKIYQPGLLDAPDIWLWAALVGGGAAQAVSVTLDGLDTASPQPVELVAELQGGSESGLPLEHHVRLSLGGTPVGETRFAGKLPHRLGASVPAPQLADGANTLELANLGDGGVYSLAFLDRLEIRYPRLRVLRQGSFEGTLADSGTLELASVTGAVAALDVTGAATWLVGLEAGPGVVRFQAEAGHRYLVVSRDGVRSPRIVRPGRSTLQSASNQADYIVVAPRAFLDAARPLLERRAGQGLTTLAAAFEEIAEAFGHGQPSAEAIRDFLTFAFQSWKLPSPRYVLLLGDASYDPRGFVSSMASPLPALWTKTSYLWTASDPELAAVNGADSLPDLAIGRLPATTVAEAEALVAKILAWEDSGQGLGGTAVLVADNPDVAGDFEADVEDVRASFFAARPTTTIKLRELGAGTRPAILGAFDDGSSFMSYVGHGGAAVWASENVLNIWDVPSLRAQSRQPLLLTLNCLNGYFVASSYDSLSEALLKADGRGVIAAFSPSGLSLDGPAHLYHRAVLGEVTSGRHARLGDALLAAQAIYAEAGVAPELVSVYHLLGDPALAIR